jgi:hypothetical protein
MFTRNFPLFLLGAMLLGTLAFASVLQLRTKLPSNRLFEMDRLGQQVGMPDGWQTSHLKELRAYDAGLSRTILIFDDEPK